MIHFFHISFDLTKELTKNNNNKKESTGIQISKNKLKKQKKYMTNKEIMLLCHSQWHNQPSI